MNPATILASYALALAAVFGVGLVLGDLVGPVGTAAEEHTGDTPHSEMGASR